MTDDSDNPFQKLAKDFSRQRTKPGAAAGSDASRSVSAPVKRRSDSAGGDDAALFLDAVSRITPLQKKRRSGGGPDLGGVLAERLKANQGGPADAESGNRPVQPQAEGRAPLQSSDAEFSAAMQDLFIAPDKGASVRPGGVQQSPPNPDEEALFAKAMQGVAPVSGKGRDLAPPSSPPASAPAVDPAKALREVLEGRVEFALHHTDEFVEGFVVGIDPLVVARLRAGRYSPEKHLDLHGMNARQAHDALSIFIKDAYQRNMRCVVVVTGRGRNSPNGMGILRPLLQEWLTRDPFKRVVLAFCTARPGDGGPGAIYVLLRKYKKSRGKIVWDRVPSDDDFPDV